MPTNGPIAASSFPPYSNAVRSAITASEFAFKLATALLIVFAGTVTLIHLEVYLSVPQSPSDFTSILF
jgi:hypothetical protein